MDEFDYSEAAEVVTTIADELAMDTDAWIKAMLS